MSADRPPPTAVLFLTHYVNSGIVRRFRKLERELAGLHDVYLAVDLASSRAHRRVTGDLVGERLFLFNLSLLKRLPYPRASGAWTFNSIVPGMVDLVVQFFARLHPRYERIYLVENDVVWSGHWRQLFAALDASPADLLGTNSFHAGEFPDWNNWSSLTTPGTALAPEQRVRFLLSFCRYSRPALRVLEQAYLRGWGGHFEALVPTALLTAGLTVEDIGGEGPYVPPGHERRFYWSERTSPADEQAGTFVYRPVQRPPRGGPPRLWHPVKLPAGLDLLHRLRRWRHGHLDRARFLAEDARYRRLEEALLPGALDESPRQP
jgi:hypothetical protein